jgi:hypothetical protein
MSLILKLEIFIGSGSRELSAWVGKRPLAGWDGPEREICSAAL